MHGRGCSKRHTVGCTDEYSDSEEVIRGPGGSCTERLAMSNGGAAAGVSGGGGRTRRSGLLTVMERPPGK